MLLFASFCMGLGGGLIEVRTVTEDVYCILPSQAHERVASPSFLGTDQHDGSTGWVCPSKPTKE